ncbi:MAG: hypothetical protein EGR71_05945 [Clostridiales bacterium]|nr:hypothetical protein [Clostridiales bacterium]
MADKDLKRLGRAELIDIIIELQKENTVLTNKNKKLTQMLNEKNIIGDYNGRRTGTQKKSQI